MTRIVIATFGSYGDLFPYLALARGLSRRGHKVVLATTPYYAEKVAAAGVDYAPIRPDVAAFGDFATVMRRVNDPKTGSEYVVRQMVMPHLRATYDDLLDVCRKTDLLITQVLALAGPLVADTLGLPWIGTALAPISFASRLDPPIFPPAPWLHAVHRVSPWLYNVVYALGSRQFRHWAQPVHDLRRELGLPPTRGNPILDGMFSPTHNLALFSPVLALPQADWPPHTVIAGFVFYEEHHDPKARKALEDRIGDFFTRHAAPLVFALGSTAVYDAGSFYDDAVAAAQQLGMPAILVTGPDPANRPTVPVGKDILVLDYAPYDLLFPHAAVVIHQGGIGTLAQVMRAGVPMLVVPFSHDQPDNAARVARLGIAKVIPRARFNAKRAVAALGRLIADPDYAVAAAMVGAHIRWEDGVATACDAIDAARPRRPRK